MRTITCLITAESSVRSRSLPGDASFNAGTASKRSPQFISCQIQIRTNPVAFRDGVRSHLHLTRSRAILGKNPRRDNFARMRFSPLHEMPSDRFSKQPPSILAKPSVSTQTHMPRPIDFSHFSETERFQLYLLAYFPIFVLKFDSVSTLRPILFCN